MEKLVKHLQTTLEDLTFSTSEKKAIRQIIESKSPSSEERAFLRNRIFKMAREAMGDARGRDNLSILKWIETANKLCIKEEDPGKNSAYFSPGTECLDAILTHLGSARTSIRICVFTISDDRIARKILECASRGVDVKIISDNDKAEDYGSDIFEFIKKGVPVRLDKTQHHMHHKFAVIDGKFLLTGSYNWTRSAALYNHENLMITEDSGCIERYLKEFDRLWQRFS